MDIGCLTPSRWRHKKTRRGQCWRQIIDEVSFENGHFENDFNSFDKGSAMVSFDVAGNPKGAMPRFRYARRPSL
jgi:hypothetical protein